MDSIILHISDFHVSLDKKNGGDKVNKDSYLRAIADNEDSNGYIDKFIKKIKDTFSNRKIYLIITGDITDCGAEIEYKYAKDYLEKIIKTLKIDRDNILLIPGDHDINRKDIENLIYSKEDISQEELNLEKFKNFAKFYKEVLDKDFDPNRIIFDQLLIEEKFIILGINSSYYINLEMMNGKIDNEKFRKELTQINLDTQLKKIIGCHHNIASLHEDKNSGQWETLNRQIFITTLEEFEIKYIFSGNEHTSGCKKITGDAITVSDSGTISSQQYDSAFKVYEIELDKDDIILTNNIYALQKTGGNDIPYFWDKRNNNDAKQPEKFEISISSPPVVEDEFLEIPTTEKKEDLLLTHQTDTIFEETDLLYYNPEFSDVLYDKVKELKLYHSGHFHWSETSRAHNWIDTSKLIENKNNLGFVKNAIIDVIEKKNLKDKIDLIIGLGYEGNIISTKATIKFNKPYTFLPYSYRSDEHHKYENDINFDNSDNKYKNILIVTDVVKDGRTIRKLIKEKQNLFFQNVDKIFVISLFYTGEFKLHPTILNYDFIKSIPDYNVNDDEEVNNIEFYTIKSLKVEKCPYGDDFREKCLIVKDKLGCVNLFYDESKYIK